MVSCSILPRTRLCMGRWAFIYFTLSVYITQRGVIFWFHFLLFWPRFYPKAIISMSDILPAQGKRMVSMLQN